MMTEPIKVLEMRDFPGLQSNADALDIEPGGAMTQVNIQSLRTGEMVVRAGFRTVVFDED